MDNIITFDKTLQERLQEYTNIFSGHDVMSVSDIKKAWSFLVELSVDPNGWQAMWKIPRLTCQDLSISFPTYVLVYVENVYESDLSALVKILAVQDDISIPDKHIVPLVQLWPTEEQDLTVGINLRATANSLDMLRFYYLYLLMPWDYDEDDSADWIDKHLESRLRLYYDMRNGVIPRQAALHLSNLLSEAKRLQAKRERLEDDLSNDECELPFETLEEIATVEDERIQTLCELNVRIMQIGDEVKLLENPLFRSVLLRKQQTTVPNYESTEKNLNENHFIVTKDLIPDDYIELLRKVKEEYPNQKVKFINDLTTALEMNESSDILLLNKGTFDLQKTAILELGGTIKGIYGDPIECEITTKGEQAVLDLCGSNILVENIIVNATNNQYAILARGGTIKLKNCIVVGNKSMSTQQGILIMNGCSFSMESCKVFDFNAAIVGQSNSIIDIKNCKVYDVDFGMKIYDGCTVKLEHSNIYNCREYGLCIETEKFLDNGEQKSGGFEVLNIIPNFSTVDVDGNNNTKGNAIIRRQQKLEPLKDLFTTIINIDDNQHSYDEMETTESPNVTVIENKN